MSQIPAGCLIRELAPQVLGLLTRRYRDFAAAEDAVQEAVIAAYAQWNSGLVPENPKAWLLRIAARRMTDHIRSESARRRRESDAAFIKGYVLPAESLAGTHDETLVLIYMCCHPALSSASAIALTLRAVGGLTTAEIAAAFLVPESTMAQRIRRAKQTILESGIPFRLPEAADQQLRLGTVLKIIDLIFNEGYTASHGESLHRPDLASEAIRLARLLRTHLPNEPEVAGLLALMLLTDARRPARTGSAGEAIPLAEQDRSLWDRNVIAEGLALIESALRQGQVGPYQLQAAISALHDEAPTAAATDWPQVLALYDLLDRITANPMVGLNRAVAAAMVHGPREGLARLAEIEQDERLKGHHRLYAVRAHLLEMAGDRAAAAADFREAAARTASLAERTYLMGKLSRLL